jgi:serine protease Do
VIHEVMPNSPAKKAGLQDGDVVTHLNDRPVDGAARLRLLVGTARPGTEALFKIIRGGKELEIKCQIGSQDRRVSSRSGRPTQTRNGTLPGELVPGLQVADVTDEDRSRLALPEGTTGVIIESVAPDSPASRAKLSPGEMITGINRTPVKGVEDAFEVAENALGEKQGKLLLLRIIGENGSRYVAVKTS